MGLAGGDPVSATTGDGCDRPARARRRTSSRKGRLSFPDDYLTDQPERALAAEWIREKLLHQTRQELPHATAVVVDRWDERADGLVEIEATIFVERESQKGIVIGKAARSRSRSGPRRARTSSGSSERQVFLSAAGRGAPRLARRRAPLREIGLA